MVHKSTNNEDIILTLFKYLKYTFIHLAINSIQSYIDQHTMDIFQVQKKVIIITRNYELLC